MDDASHLDADDPLERARAFARASGALSLSLEALAGVAGLSAYHFARQFTARFGISPVQMGVIFLANLELGYLTPPIGMNLCLSAYRFRQPLTLIYRATLPFYVILLIGVLLITYLPALTTWPVEWLGF